GFHEVRTAGGGERKGVRADAVEDGDRLWPSPELAAFVRYRLRRRGRSRRRSAGCHRRLELVSGRPVHVERTERRDLVHVRIEHADRRRPETSTRRKPDGAVFGDLNLRGVSRELRLRIKRERLIPGV